MASNIPVLRHRAWNLSNNAINNINTINAVLYKNMTYRPDVLEAFENENINDVSIQYLGYLVSKANEYLKILKETYKVFDYINLKHNECLELLKK